MTAEPEEREKTPRRRLDKTAVATAENPPTPAEPAEAAASEAPGPARDTPPAEERGSGAPSATEHGLYERLWATGLLNVFTIAGRELGAYFASPIGYVVAAVLVYPIAFLGYLAPVAFGQPITMDSIFSLTALLMVFFTPLYTMRLLAEDRRSGTLEVLLTSPVRDWEVVTGKWLAGFLFYLATIAFTLVFPVLIAVYQPFHDNLNLLGHTFPVPALDYGSILTGYLGVILIGAAWVALGLLASSLTSNQIIAAVLGIGLLLAFEYLFGQLSQFLLQPYSSFFDYLSAANRGQSFNQGRLVLRDVVYFLTLTLAALFIATRTLESRKWR